MASLFEINQLILDCIDPDTGEVIDAEALDQLMLDRSTKIENIALWIKNLESDITAIDAEIDAFRQRKESAQTKIESLKRYLADALNGEKFHSTRCDVTFRRSESVVITDKTLIPIEMQRVTVESKPDKALIKDALKAGKSVAGAELVENLNTQIK